MPKLTMIVNIVITDENGKATVKDVLELHQMDLVDVLRMEKKLNDALGSRIDEQIKECK